MDIAQRREGEVLIVELSGPMTIGQSEEEPADTILAALMSGEKKILLDMGDVPTVDSFGVGVLISLYTSAKRRKAAMKLLRFSPRAREVLIISGLIGVFEIFDDEAAAVASFA